MTYKTDLLTRVRDGDKWPHFARSDFLSKLNSVADEAFGKDTTEGYLASVLIYHQLCEEIVKLLIECSNFFIQIAVFPAEINFKKKKKRMFGQLLEELESGINIKKKDELISKCKELNNIRIKIVHKLTLKTSVSDIKGQVREIKKIYDDIFDLFEVIYDEYRVIFHGYEKDEYRDNYLLDG